MERFQGGLAFKANIVVYHSHLGSRVIKKKKSETLGRRSERIRSASSSCLSTLTPPPLQKEIDISLPNNQRQHRTLHIQENMLPYALFVLLCPVSAALASIFRMDSISTSYPFLVFSEAEHPLGLVELPLHAHASAPAQGYLYFF